MNKVAIVFDLDNTLYAESDYFKQVLIEFAHLKSLDQTIFEDIFKNFDDYRATKHNIFKFILESLGLFSEANYNDLFDVYTKINCTLSPYQDIDIQIGLLIQKGYKIGVLTNGVILSQCNKWQNLKLSNKDEIFFKTAREYGADKPNSNSFNLFMADFGHTFSECIFVGDKFKNDIEYPVQQGGAGYLITEQIDIDFPLKFNKTTEVIASILNSTNY